MTSGQRISNATEQLVIRLLQRGYSIRSAASASGVSVSTAQKIAKLLTNNTIRGDKMKDARPDNT